MNFLTNLIKHLKDYSNKLLSSAMEIPLHIGQDELLVRGIVHPIFYSNSGARLKKEAFLPPPGGCDVSILRHQYTTDNFCKKHSQSLKIGQSTYCGIATFLHFHVIKMSEINESTFLTIRATPLDDNQKIRRDLKIKTSDSGLPMHADLIYSSPAIKGEPNTEHRKYANELCKTAYFLKDTQPTIDHWVDEKICWKEN